jgi:2-oxoisovalerate dehydrogenase E2 component (dihydrolipoyl transacylase)
MIFNLPDLGEGLAEAEIREWYVKEGDTVNAEQPLVSVETAKAVVDVPSPHAGKIAKLYGKSGDIIQTGKPLVEFSDVTSGSRGDTGTVVGKVEVGHKVLKEEATGIQTKKSDNTSIKASPAVRALAKKLNVALANIKGSGPQGSITLEDVSNTSGGAATIGAEKKPLSEMLRGIRRVMAINMAQAHQEIVPVTLMDDADIDHWPKGTDISVRIIRAIIAGCAAEPALNAHFDGKTLSRELFSDVNLGLAIDMPNSLYVPVLKTVNKKSDAEVRQQIDQFKKQAEQKNFSPTDLQDGTITLSNFGMLAGRYANPIVVPPTVAIIGVGKLHTGVVAIDGKPVAHRLIPLSLTFDHRAATGGEAARFLAAMIADLQK